MAFDLLLYVVFPYIAIIMATVGWFYRAGYDKYSITSHSSQFLGEKNTLLVGSYFWHYSIIAILFMHAFGILLPDVFNMVVTNENRTYWEYAGYVLSVISIFGMVMLIYRRLNSRRLMAVTTGIDWLVLGLLTLQISLGLYVAISSEAIGSAWFISTMVPWIQSLVIGAPDYQAVASLGNSNPWYALHFINGMLLIALVPFSRLGHLIAYPFKYAWRKMQVVVWNHNPALSE